MEPIRAPDTLTVYQLIKQSGLSFTNAGSSSLGMGVGFYPTLQEAEYNRTIELLKNTTTIGAAACRFHIFELEVPNPAYQE